MANRLNCLRLMAVHQLKQLIEWKDSCRIEAHFSKGGTITIVSANGAHGLHSLTLHPDQAGSSFRGLR
jgi:hypothetical protein